MKKKKKEIMIGVDETIHFTWYQEVEVDADATDKEIIKMCAKKYKADIDENGFAESMCEWRTTKYERFYKIDDKEICRVKDVLPDPGLEK